MQRSLSLYVSPPRLRPCRWTTVGIPYTVLIRRQKRNHAVGGFSVCAYPQNILSSVHSRLISDIRDWLRGCVSVCVSLSVLKKFIALWREIWNGDGGSRQLSWARLLRFEMVTVKLNITPVDAYYNGVRYMRTRSCCILFWVFYKWNGTWRQNYVKLWWMNVEMVLLSLLLWIGKAYKS